jgi:hypothetical protein
MYIHPLLWLFVRKIRHRPAISPLQFTDDTPYNESTIKFTVRGVALLRLRAIFEKATGRVRALLIHKEDGGVPQNMAERRGASKSLLISYLGLEKMGLAPLDHRSTRNGKNMRFAIYNLYSMLTGYKIYWQHRRIDPR